jgi:hypothetical protein
VSVQIKAEASGVGVIVSVPAKTFTGQTSFHLALDQAYELAADLCRAASGTAQSPVNRLVKSVLLRWADADMEAGRLREALREVLSCREGGAVSCDCGAVEKARALLSTPPPHPEGSLR